ncbi:MAG TPA: threonine--tRNA ligase [Alphaproteobacteria bacterium]|nr:threonine--tRNA ligase [Alphaproteobacteria bacterium]
MSQALQKTSVKLPDGSIREFTGTVTGADVAMGISPGLAKQALAMRLGGKVVDLSTPVPDGAEVAIITRNPKTEADQAEALAIIRHDAAHVMAEAVQELFPGTQVTIGPSIENGFYYDFHRAEPFSTDDLGRIEAKMREIVQRNKPFTREEWSRDEAKRVFAGMGETFKVELVDAIPDDQTISIYRQGDWFDLCRGPHAPSTGHVGQAFKLMKVAGAYWRGDARNPQLQRIYGTAWRDEKELKAYLTMLEEAEKRDHRKLGREMDLFHLQEEAQGSVFWHPKGWTLYRTLENFVRDRIDADGYVEVKTPQLLDRSLWVASGHWENYAENMFTVQSEEDKVLAVKPMNCPCHVQIFNQGIKSYRDLPIRMAEFGSCHRNEPSGALHGIMRVRAFTQDDAHIFCTEEQIVEESIKFCNLLQGIYRDLGFERVIVKLSTRPEKRAGTDATWDKAEAGLADACRAAGLDFAYNPGEGAFYGPKLEFTLRDAIGRDWQCGTLQLDFVLPERLDASYIGADGQRHRPVMLHRAILGSLERFIGVLIEHYAGRLPLWLAPVQAVAATVVSEADGYVAEVAETLRRAGLRVETDTRNEKIGYKVREHSLKKVPVLLVAGKREAEQRTVTLRRLGSEAQETLALDEAVNKLVSEGKVPVAGAA